MKRYTIVFTNVNTMEERIENKTIEEERIEDYCYYRCRKNEEFYYEER
jgi:hypothetical protein